jgi:hypothetical protein
MKNRPVGDELLTDKQTDGQTEVTKLIFAFRSFSKAPKNLGGGWRKVLNKKLLDFYISPDTTGITKSWTMRGEGNVAPMWKNRNINEGFWLGKLKERDDFENLVLYWDLILKRIFKKGS